MSLMMEGFKNWCGIPTMQGAIDGTHISIVKPTSYAENYYYHKNYGYSIVAQMIINCNKTFTNVFVNLLGSVNDSKVLHKYALSKKNHYHGLIKHDTWVFSLQFG
jgi:hypothetical protein